MDRAMHNCYEGGGKGERERTVENTLVRGGEDT